MRHFISLQKKKGIHLVRDGYNNSTLVHRLNHELMGYGFVLSKDLFDVASTQSEEIISNLYQDLISNLKKSYSESGYQPIYKSFPEGVKNMSYEEFYVNAILYYWTNGRWSPEANEYIEREYKIEPIKYKEVTLLSEKEYNNILFDIIYANSSISKWDKQIITWFLENTSLVIDLAKVKFKETLAFVAKQMLDNEDIKKLSTSNATDVLRIVSAYFDGDEGLKENTRFKNFKKFQKRLLLNTLNECFNLEESFKQYREKWLRLLFYLNPYTNRHRKLYPQVAKYFELLRNNPKQLKTFNSYIEEYLQNKDKAIFQLLKTRMGIFTRRLDHLVREFGAIAFDEYMKGNPNIKQRIEVYNHFFERDKEQNGRTSILASSSASNVVNYKSLAPLNEKIVRYVREEVLKGIAPKLGRIYIDPALYYRPMDANTRANNFSINERAKGTVEKIENIGDGKNVVRCFVHWEGTNDIDLSAMIICVDNSVTKVGWNGNHTVNGITYSGDNTGTTGRCAEYIDIDFNDNNIKSFKWIILDAKVFRGPNYSNWNKSGVYAGWEVRKHAKANSHWLPENLSNVSKITCDSNVAYLLALHIPSKSIIYLDVSAHGSNVTGKEDALKMEVFLKKYLPNITNEVEISWDIINQGHILHLLAENVVDKDDADIVFDENTTWESIAKYL